MSVAAVAWAFEQALPPNEKVVLLALADCENGQSLACMPGQEFLAEKASMSVRTVQRMLIALEAKGLISRDRRTLSSGQRTSDSYTLSLRSQPHANLSGGHQANTTTVSGGNTTTVSGIREQEEGTGSNPIVPSGQDDVEDDEAAEPSPIERLIDEVWNLYPTPRRSTRKVVSQKINTLITTTKASEREELATTILEALRTHCDRWRTWPADEQKFIPLLTTWLNQERWTGAVPEARSGSGAPSTTLVDRNGQPAYYGLTPGGRRMGPPAHAGEHPRSPWLGMAWTADRRGDLVYSRTNSSIFREPDEMQRRILNGADD